MGKIPGKTESNSQVSRVRIKICGITRHEDAMAAVALGVDAIGLVFYPSSPRSVDIARAREIVSQLPPLVTKVGLFVNADEAYIQQVLAELPLDLLQFHGDETIEQCRRYARPYIKAIKMSQGVDLTKVMNVYHDAAAILLDACVEGVAGGTGQVFDWHLVPATVEKPVILAGGLNSDNVAGAIAQVKPYAVDVSGGVEQDTGIKSIEKMKAFIGEVVNAQSG